MEELLKKLGIEDNVINNILKAMKDNKIYTTKEENIEERYSKLKNQKDDIEGQLKTANGTIKDLKKNNLDNEELQKAIKEHENTIKTLKSDSETKIRNLTLDSAIDNALLKNKAKYSELLASKFDREKLAINEDGTVSGLEEQVKQIKETYNDMFGATLKGGTPPNPDTKPTQINSWDYLVNNADNMTAEQIAEAYNNVK